LSVVQGIDSPAVAVLEALAGRERASRAELADLTGLSTATVGRTVEALRRSGVLRELARSPSGVGRPPRVVELDGRAATVVALDVGGGTLRAALADMSGVIHSRVARTVRDPDDGEALLDDLLSIVREVAAIAPGDSVQAVAAGISGIVDADAGRVLIAPDLPGLDGVSLGPEVARCLDRPVAIDNDDLLAAVGEASRGAAVGCRDVAFLSLGFGLGAGLIVDGRPVHGATHAAGAIAYLAAPMIGDRSSGRAIAARYQEGVGGPVALDARTVFALAARGDLVASRVIDEATEGLGDLVVTVAALIDPEIVVLGGGLTDAGPALFDPIARRLREGVPYPPRLAASALGDAAVLHGATSIALSLARRRLAGLEPLRRASSSRPGLSLV
jgi:predicted NBD/HSP70 family sugar kinase